MTVEQLSRGNEITKELNTLHETIEDRVKILNTLDSEQEDKDSTCWVSISRMGAYFKTERVKEFLNAEIKTLRDSIRELEAEFTKL